MAETIQNILQRFNEGQLQEAIDVCTQSVTKAPMDLRLRLVLAQLICFTGDWARVNKIVDQACKLDRQQEHIVLTSLIQQMVKAEEHREAVWLRGAVPDFLLEPSAVDKKMLWLAGCFRENQFEQAIQARDEVESLRPRHAIQIAGETYPDLRDTHDLTATFLEAHSMTGQYYWIPFSAIERMDVSPPRRLMDYLWNQARVHIRNQSELILYLPGTYFGSCQSDDEAIRLGRASALTQHASGLTLGLGRRVFQLGDEFEADPFEFQSAMLV